MLSKLHRGLRSNKNRTSLSEHIKTAWLITLSCALVVALAFVLKIGRPLASEKAALYLSSPSFASSDADYVEPATKNNVNVDGAYLKKEDAPPLSFLYTLQQLNPFVTSEALAQGEKNTAIAPQPNPRKTDLNKSPTLSTLSNPTIRVGITKKLNPVTLTSSGSFRIVDALGTPLLTLGPEDAVTLYYDIVRQHYSVRQGDIVATSTWYLKIIPLEKDAVFTMKNFSNRPAWNPSLNDNTYRGGLEFFYAPATKNIWVINELPLEDYLKGIAETTSQAPLEYLKIMTISARSYALWHYLDKQKHSNEFYDVDATYDQVYKGYGLEKRHSKLTQAVEETRGIVATFNGLVAVTPYFSGSDGRTRSWEEAWFGNPFPWIKSVAVPEEQGKKLLGHGVGLSARGAYLKVVKGASVEDVFSHFFPDLSLKKVYN